MTKIVKRDIFDQIVEHLSNKEITVITGARQTGKTTLLLQLKEYLLNNNVKESQIKFFNLDLISDWQHLKSQDEFIRYIKEQLLNEKFLYIFIDEVQKLDNPGVYLKGIYDLNLPIKLIVSGSSSLEIKSKMFESLTGRKRVFHLWTFAFKEYLSYVAPEILNLEWSSLSKITEATLIQHLYDYIIFGGYPKVVLTDSKQEKIKVLEEIYSSYIEKDVINFMKIRNPMNFIKLVNIVASQCGKLLNLNELSSTVGINFRTLEHYLYILENSFIIKLVRPFYTNIRKELTKMPKVYFTDNGLMNFILKDFTDFNNNLRKGEILENYVFSSLLKVWEGSINYWRTKEKTEVDFILRDFYGNTFPVEVKSNLKKPEVEYSLRSFLERYKPKKAFVINLQLKEEICLESCTVKFISPYMIERIKKEISV